MKRLKSGKGWTAASMGRTTIVVLCLIVFARAQESPEGEANPRFPSLWGYGSINSLPNPAFVGQTTYIDVTVTNGGGAPATNVEVVLSYNDWSIGFGPDGWQEIGTQVIDLGASGVAVLEFEHEFQSRAHTCLEAKIRSVGDGGNSNANDDRAQVNMEVVYCSDDCTYSIPLVNSNDHAITVGDLQFGCRLRERFSSEQEDGTPSGLVDCPFDVQVDVQKEDDPTTEPFSTLEIPPKSDTQVRFRADLSSAPPVIDVYVQAKDLDTGELNHVVLRLVRTRVSSILNSPLFCCITDLRQRLKLERNLAEALEAYERGAAKTALALLRKLIDRSIALECEFEEENLCIERALAMVTEAAKMIAEQFNAARAEIAGQARERREGRARRTLVGGVSIASSRGDFMMRQGQYAASCLQYMKGVADDSSVTETQVWKAPAGTEASDQSAAPEGAGVSPFDVQLAGTSGIRIRRPGAVVARDESVVLLQGDSEVQVTGGTIRIESESLVAGGGSSISVLGGSLEVSDDAVLTFTESSTIQVSGGSLKVSGDKNEVKDESDVVTETNVGTELQLRDRWKSIGISISDDAVQTFAERRTIQASASDIDLEMSSTTYEVVGGSLQVATALEQKMREIISLHIGQAGVQVGGGISRRSARATSTRQHISSASRRSTRMRELISLHIGQGGTQMGRETAPGVDWFPGVDWAVDVQRGLLRVRRRSELELAAAQLELQGNPSAHQGLGRTKVTLKRGVVSVPLGEVKGGEQYAVDGGTLEFQTESSLTVSGGSVQFEDNSNVVFQSGECAITGGSLVVADSATFLAEGGGTLTITGGNFKLADSSELVITGGSIELQSDSEMTVESGSTIKIGSSTIAWAPSQGSCYPCPPVKLGQGSLVFVEEMSISVSGGSIVLSESVNLTVTENTIEFEPGEVVLNPDVPLTVNLATQPIRLFAYSDIKVGGGALNIGGKSMIGGLQKSYDVYSPYNDGLKRGGESQWNFHVWNTGLVAGGVQQSSPGNKEDIWNFHVWNEIMMNSEHLGILTTNENIVTNNEKP